MHAWLTRRTSFSSRLLLGLTDIRQAATLSDIEPPYAKLMSDAQLAACLEVRLKTEVPSHTQSTEQAVKLTTPPPRRFFPELLKKNAQSQRAEIPAMLLYIQGGPDNIFTISG